ncbi:hypothetical protein JCM16161A_22320 [Vulcanisaeta sp. JCM 16161]|uniref:ATP-binding protein n=1 Tax=Vulcanisaeta sp. JCM 16161 TaxID=1295372 RepID=UPI0006D1F5BA|nr:ATP-binding protein [Vulcanisaeta sp. JCM 16161]
MKRIRLGFANLIIEFTDRYLALKRIEYWANRGTGFPKVVYGPEGCGKTAWLRQSVELLGERGFDVIYLNPIEEEFAIEIGVQSLRDRLINLVREATSRLSWGGVAWSVIDVVREAISLGRGKIAIIIDDAFQAIGLDRAAIYVKGLLGILEHPPRPYERIVTIVATSEGVSRREIGRHEWADLLAMWNMGRDGFRQLYEQVPGDKPPFEEVWKLTGGNPRILERLYENNWNGDAVVRELIDKKGVRAFIASLGPNDRELLIRALEDPDVLMGREGIPLMNRLIELNLALEIPEWRDDNLWIDAPPPERDLELGIGKYVAWQSPLHREAVKRALGMT